jgi:hypothetical protein
MAHALMREAQALLTAVTKVHRHRRKEIGYGWIRRLRTKKAAILATVTIPA